MVSHLTTCCLPKWCLPTDASSPQTLARTTTCFGRYAAVVATLALSLPSNSKLIRLARCWRALSFIRPRLPGRLSGDGAILKLLHRTNPLKEHFCFISRTMPRRHHRCVEQRWSAWAVCTQV